MNNQSQNELGEKLAEINNINQAKRDYDLATTQHNNQIARDNILADINHKKSVRLTVVTSVVTAIVTALIGLVAFFAKEGYDSLRRAPNPSEPTKLVEPKPSSIATGATK